MYTHVEFEQQLFFNPVKNEIGTHTVKKIQVNRRTQQAHTLLESAASATVANSLLHVQERHTHLKKSCVCNNPTAVDLLLMVFPVTPYAGNTMSSSISLRLILINP